MPEHSHFEVAARRRDRRLTPRYVCCGEAQITPLPSDGMLFRGRLRNLGLGGCYVETGFLFLVGTRTEVLVQANALCFRAMAEVKAVREKYGIGLEFLRLSTRGYRSLAEVLVELEHQNSLLATSGRDNEAILSEFGSRLLTADPGQAHNKKLAAAGTLISSRALATRCVPAPVAILEADPENVEPHATGSIIDLFG
jgi:hypothetical protein